MANPAAIGALARGDIENFLVASQPGGIERQEAQGQRDLVSTANKLPADMRPGVRVALESLGFVFGDKVEDIFIAAQFPAGWSIQPTEHSMHSDLVDPQGRKRGGIFYKAAFYDRNAHFSLKARYYATQDYAQPDSTHYIYDTATDKRKHVIGTVAYLDFVAGDAMQREADAWLETNLPDYRNPLAYWDEA
ncbi:MAG: hypothetical protein V4730_11930 [Pseudomonadota bacterium]